MQNKNETVCFKKKKGKDYTDRTGFAMLSEIWDESGSQCEESASLNSFGSLMFASGARVRVEVISKE